MKNFILLFVTLCGVLCITPTRAEELPTFHIVAKNGRFTPAQLEVPAGRKIKLVIKNEGPGPEEFESADLRIEKVLAAGATSFVVINNLKPGTYRFIGEFHAETAKLDVIAK